MQSTYTANRYKLAKEEEDPAQLRYTSYNCTYEHAKAYDTLRKSSSSKEWTERTVAAPCNEHSKPYQQWVYLQVQLGLIQQYNLSPMSYPALSTKTSQNASYPIQSHESPPRNSLPAARAGGVCVMWLRLKTLNDRIG